MLINRIALDPHAVTLLNFLDPGVLKLWSCCFPDGGYGQKPFWYTLPGASNVVARPIINLQIWMVFNPTHCWQVIGGGLCFPV
jgi:hypothetical protein